MHAPGYINGRLCEGTKRSPTHYSLPEIKELAKSLGLSTVGNKDVICERVRAHYTGLPGPAAKPVPKPLPKPVPKPLPKPVPKLEKPQSVETIKGCRLVTDDAYVRVYNGAGCNTYTLSHIIKSTGGVWDPKDNSWVLPVANKGKLIELLNGPEEDDKNDIFPYVIKDIDGDTFLFGPTFEIKEHIKTLCMANEKAQWRPDQRAWYIPDHCVSALREFLVKYSKKFPQVKHAEKYEALVPIIDVLGAKDIKTLVRLNKGVLDSLINTIEVHERSTTLKAMTQDMSEEDRIKTLLSVLAGKLCRCIKKVHRVEVDDDESKAIAICINSIFKRRGLKMHGFRCDEGAETLLPSAEGYLLESE